MTSRIQAGVLLFLLGSIRIAMAGETPQAFLQRLYAAYAPHGKGNDFSYPDARAIVDASLLARLRNDRIKSKGEVGAMDSDPICQCQDWESFKVVSLHAQMNGPGRARGDVTFRPDPQSTMIVHFDLVQENGAWKIHDLSSQETPSLLAYLHDYKY
ncbi:MAG TPA: DUF3828 domain-containing protein [Rhizomicrobium sp.]|jgi:hypothetical protein|nr:DUF3828 domain-containing protein [Rhizomicrobium sp.]